VFFKGRRRRERDKEKKRERETSLHLFKGLEIEPRYITFVINKILKKPHVF
jgi:hypothetical protein